MPPTVDAAGGESCQMKLARGGPEARRIGDTSAGFKARYFNSRTIDPSDTFGAATPVPAAFFAQSLAFSRLSSVPALSLQTVTEKPPSALRTRVKLTKPLTERNVFSTSACSSPTHQTILSRLLRNMIVQSLYKSVSSVLAASKDARPSGRAIQGNVVRPAAPGSPRRHSPSKDGRLSTPYGFLAVTISSERSTL
jgi:hypothetical protein